MPKLVPPKEEHPQLERLLQTVQKIHHPNVRDFIISYIQKSQPRERHSKAQSTEAHNKS